MIMKYWSNNNDFGWSMENGFNMSYMVAVRKLNATRQFDDSMDRVLPQLFLHYLMRDRSIIEIGIDRFKPIMTDELLNLCLLVKLEVSVIALFDSNRCINAHNLYMLIKSGASINRVGKKYSIKLREVCIVDIQSITLIKVACDMGYTRVFDLMKKKEYNNSYDSLIIKSEFNTLLMPAMAEAWGIWPIGEPTDYDHVCNISWLADNLPPGNDNILRRMVAYGADILDISIYDSLFIDNTIYLTRGVLKRYYKIGGKLQCNLSHIRYLSDLLYVIPNASFIAGDGIIYAARNTPFDELVDVYCVCNLATRNMIINSNDLNNIIEILLFAGHIDLVDDILVRYHRELHPRCLNYLVKKGAYEDIILFCLRLMPKTLNPISDYIHKMQRFTLFIEGPPNKYGKDCSICLEPTPGIMVKCPHCLCSPICSSCFDIYRDMSDIMSTKCLICRERLLAYEWLSFIN